VKSPSISLVAWLFVPLLLAEPFALAGCGEEQARSPEAPSVDQAAPAVAKDVVPAAPSPPVAVTPPAVTSAPLPAAEVNDSSTAAAAESVPLPPAEPPASPSASRSKYRAGEDPDFAQKCGWPVCCPAPLPGAILPQTRIVAYYGNPNSRRMGALGEFNKDEMLNRLDDEVDKWQAADPDLPVQPALHLIAVVAQDAPGKAGKYRMIMPDDVVKEVYGWAREANALLFIDIQTGHDDIRSILPRFEWILKNPDVHLGIDPEFNLVSSLAVPGTRVGTYDAADVNYVSGYLAELVRKYGLPPKVLTVHRFTRNGVTNARSIELRPEVQIVMHMDGWGAPWLKRSTYKDYIVSEPVQYTGFKLFYHNDTKKGDPLLTPQEVLRLRPQPVYIQYQ